MSEDAALLTVKGVVVLPGHAARLTLEDGQTVTLSPEGTPRASFLPLTAQGFAVLLEDWKDPAARVFAVPAPHDAQLVRLFEEEKRALTLRRPLPAVTRVEALPDGGARLTLEGGEALEVPAGQNASLSPGTAPIVLAFSEGPLSDRAVTVPGLLLPAVWAALFGKREA